MFKHTISILCGLLINIAALAQNTTVQFVGKDRTGNDYVRLDHVSVFDDDQLWHEILYYPDTTLRLGAVSIENHQAQNFQLLKNMPNPFNGTTDIALSLPESRDVTMEICDMNGKVLVLKQFSSLQEGTHLFRATLSTPQTYLLSANTKDGKTSIKLVNEGATAMNSMEYVGMTNSKGGLSLILNDGKSGGSYPFNKGDRMKYIGYALVDNEMRVSSTVQQNQYGDEVIPLCFDVARPSVTTYSAQPLSASSVCFNGSVLNDHNAQVTERGFCYSNTTSSPTLNNSRVVSGAGLGDFSANATNLSAGTNYYVRAYAINMVGVTYGAYKIFRTNDTIPTVVTASPFQISATSFLSGGNVQNDNGASVSSRGVCWSTSHNPTTANSCTSDGNGTGSFTSSVTGLNCGTTYYVRAYATNSVGTAYGDEYSVTTLSSSIPEVTTNNASNITSNSATCGGTVTSSGCNTVTARGVCWSTSQNPTVSNSHTTNGSGTGSFSSNITGLTVNTTYYVRAYATNSLGTAYGNQISFTTAASLPTVTTNSITNITSTTATCGGNVTATGGATVTARGVCWSTSQNPTVSNSHTTNGSGTGSFTSSITGLNPNTTYYVRAYATNSAGTAYGTQRSFTTSANPCPSVTDYDGNTYNTVQIGQQCWMKQNLRTTHYSDGSSIPAGGSNTSTTNPYYYDFSSSGIALSSRGYLYNWPAVMHGSSSSSANPSNVQGICPTGWHVPSDAEWTQLTNYVSSQSQYVCGSYNTNIAKALASTTGWNSSTNTCAVGNSQSTNNATGFSAVPAGYCFDSSFYSAGSEAHFWSSTQNESNPGYAYYRYLYFSNANVGRTNYYKYLGYSVRCLRD